MTMRAASIMRMFTRRAATWFSIALLLGAVCACQGIPATVSSPASAVSTDVVLLHGLRRSSWSMKKIEWDLEAAGFTVCNIDYPSAQLQVTGLIDHIVHEIQQCFGDVNGPVNFVSHSLGGLMVRAIQVAGNGPGIARVVMIAPPNHGSELVDLHRNSKLFRAMMGPVAVLLGTDPGSLPRRLGPATFDVGIIAGVGKSNPLGLWIFDEPNDGTVSVASARLEGMSDFIEVPFGHTFIMRKKPVINEVRHYLKSGAFSRQFKQ